jgi:cephalosporin hydroxylase
MKAQLHGLYSELKTLRRSVYRNLYNALGSRENDQKVVDMFSQLYFDAHIFDKSWGKMTWMGTPILKCPMDLWVYQELVYGLKPDLVIETGTAAGGSARYFSSLFDLVGNGEIITIDIEKRSDRPQHPRITYMTGSSTAPDIFARVKEKAASAKTVMVVLDSDHTEKHVRAELELYHPLVTLGSYMVVEDSNVNGHPVAPDYGPGPMEALVDFLKTNKSFEIDKHQERFFLTWNPNGYLKRVK